MRWCRAVGSLVILAALTAGCGSRSAPGDEVAQGSVRSSADNSTSQSGSEPTGTEPTGAEPTGVEPGAEPTAAEPTGAQPTGAEPPGAEPPGAEPPGRESETDPPPGSPPTRGGTPGTPTKGKQPGALGSPIKFDPSQQNPTLDARREYFRTLLAEQCGADLCDVTITVVFRDEPGFVGEDCSVHSTDWPKPPHRGMVITIVVWNPCSENKDRPQVTPSSVTTPAEHPTTTAQDTARATEPNTGQTAEPNTGQTPEPNTGQTAQPTTAPATSPDGG